MPPIVFTEVLTFSSEDPNHPAENLIRADTFRKWKCAPGTAEKQSSVTLKLEKLSSIQSIDIGNEGSAFVEVLAGREGAAAFQVLLVASSFMTPIESRNCSDMHRVRMFGPDKLNKNVATQKWDRLKIICTQPFNKNMQYGLSFITVRAPGDDPKPSPPKMTRLGSFTLKDEEEDDNIKTGDLFARRKEKESSPAISGAAGIRAASAAALASVSSPGANKRKSQDPPPESGFYQLKKTKVSDPDPTKTSPVSKPARPPSASTPHRNDQSYDRERDKVGVNGRKIEKHEVKHRPSESGEKERKGEKHKSKNSSVEKTQTATTPKPTASGPVPQKAKKSKPFTSLMDDILFVMSGYQNPQRSQLRDMMLDMGARYQGDWDKKCTHLICAFTNTPKYQQVKGRGKIVSAKWITDCHKNKIRYPCKRYSLEKGRDQAESEEEVWAEELLPKESKPVVKPAAPSPIPGATATPELDDDTDSDDNEDTDDEIERVLARQKKNEAESTSKKADSSENNTRPDTQKRIVEKDTKLPPQVNIRKNKTTSQAVKTNEGLRTDKDTHVANGATVSSDDEVYDDDTDVDEANIKYLKPPDTSALPLPSLGDFLKGKYFYIYGKLAEEKKQLLRRYIIAFKGELEDYMSEKVQIVITEDRWDKNFDEALNDNPNLQFVKPVWIWRCCDKQKLVPYQPYLVVPAE
ncbi:DNA repair protein XRCC1-like isoform X2 [Homarus americanus]|uniref:DNA repair protein XRCC1 n=1 Tax=Homarus americanus TaxID=6706 RepID=A0A8J5JFH3_HOMAM|nr:DNA repair protein XRCC1-like isoform X2 [Homarus americanus]KAG7154615.1 DNA repair protein XRCC1-like [Homarus americanus]